MSDEHTIGGDTFEYGRDRIDATMDGLFGGIPDLYKVFIPGMPWYRINGVLVSEEEFKRRIAEAQRTT